MNRWLVRELDVAPSGIGKLPTEISHPGTAHLGEESRLTGTYDTTKGSLRISKGVKVECCYFGGDIHVHVHVCVLGTQENYVPREDKIMASGREGGECPSPPQWP